MKELIKQLKDLSEWETHPFKKRAYLKAVEIFEQMEKAEFNTRKNFKDIEGIGDAINKKILQFKETGYIKKWKETRETSPVEKSKGTLKGKNSLSESLLEDKKKEAARG